METVTVIIIPLYIITQAKVANVTTLDPYSTQKPILVTVSLLSNGVGYYLREDVSVAFPSNIIK